jgi:hypothetical protein
MHTNNIMRSCSGVNYEAPCHKKELHDTPCYSSMLQNIEHFSMPTPDAELPLLKLEQIVRVESIIDYTFQKTERAYLWEALQVITPDRASVVGRSLKGGNKKLAIIGDAIMAVVLAEYWFSNNDSISGESHNFPRVLQWLTL